MGIIGAEAAHPERNNQSKSGLLWSLTLTLFIFYFMQTSCYYLWTHLMFPIAFPGAINDMYFGYSNLLEFFIFIFVRTRVSIKYCAKMLTIINLIFLMYINSYMYGAMIQLFSVLFGMTCIIFFSFLLYLEQPAMTEWNPFDQNTPRYQSPRIGYQLVLDDTNFGTGFYIWHAFFPPRGRESFTMTEQGHFNHLAEYQRFGIDYSTRREQPRPRVGQPQRRNTEPD